MTEEKNNQIPQTESQTSSAPAEQPRAILTTSENRPPRENRNQGEGSSNRSGGSGGRMKKRRWLKPVVRKVRVLKTERREGDAQHDSKVGGLKIIHFGGLGEVGRNMSAIQYDNDIILIDAGVRFAEEDMPGIDFIIPNTKWLEDKKDKVKAMFFTHGHMDHFGALPFVRDKIGDPDIYAAPLTRAIIIKRQDDF